MVTFAEVKQVLDSAITGWTNKNNGAVPNLTGRHQDPKFGWSSKQQLLEATAKGFRLIEPGKIGQPDKQGKNTNLVVALSDPKGVGNNGQMPDLGPFLKPVPDIQKIIDWIDQGCPD